MSKIDYRQRQKQLERAHLFDVDMNEDHRYYDALNIDEGYNYLPVRWTERIRRLIVLGIVAVSYTHLTLPTTSRV